VIVIGGGVIGTASAYYLAKAGCRVTLVEQYLQGAGCSDGNCGLIARTHVLPLNEPGAVHTGLGSFFARNSALKIRLRTGPALWGWLVQFAWHSNRAAMIESARARQALLESSAALFDELFAEESIFCEFEKRGVLFVFQTEKAMKGFETHRRMMTETFGIEARRYEGSELVELEPALKRGLAGAWHFPDDAQLRPEKLLAGWREALTRRGVTIRERVEVLGFRRKGAKAVAVTTTDGPLEADAFVLAAGALSPRFARQLSCRIPIQPGKGYSLTMARPKRCPTIPLNFQEHKVVVTPFASGYRLGSMMEFSGYDVSLPARRLNLLRRAAEHYLHEPYVEPVDEAWYGWRPMTYDGKPLVGPCPAMGNVVVASGHNMLGLSMAPATGRLVTELLTGQPPHIDPEPLAVTRFTR